MNLGTLIANLHDEVASAKALDALGDIVLYAQVCAMADRLDETPAAYVATSAGRFAAMAGDEAWMSLISAMERGPNPGVIALKRMLRWSLDLDAEEQAEALVQPGATSHSACSCGSGRCGS